MASGYSVEVIKAVIGGPIGEGLGEVSVVPAFRRGSVGLPILEPQVPFADHSGPVAIVAEKGGDGRAGLLDQGVTLDPEEDPVFKGGAPAIAPGQQGIT